MKSGRGTTYDRLLHDPWESDDDIPLIYSHNKDKLAEVHVVLYSMFIDSASSAKSDKLNHIMYHI